MKDDVKSLLAQYPDKCRWWSTEW